jgi:20S proteasome subunit alpha 6
LEKHLSEFFSSDLDELVKHGLRALRDTLPNEVDLSVKNVSIGIVGKDYDFTILDESATAIYLSQIEGDEKRGRPGEQIVQDDKPPQDPPAEEGPQDPQVAIAMDTD